MYHFLPHRVCMFVSSKGVSMENRKIYPIIFALSAMIFFCHKAEAQLNAQSDLFNVLESSCSNYLDISVNDNLDSLPLQQLQILSQPLNGTASVNGNFLSYCALNGFTGADNFKYLIVAGGQTDSATVYINVLPYNNFIFPGDADQNGQVENFDVLALGLAYNLKGPSRFDSVSVNALAWSPSAYTNTDPGAADCNGDGIVDALDMASVETAYHDTFPYPSTFEIETSQCTGTGLPFYIESLSGDTVYDGDTLDIVIKLGNDFTSNEAYGIAFTLEFDNGFIPGNSVQFFTNSSWLLQNDAGLFFNRSFQTNGEIEIALTKTNHNAEHGGGELLRARLPIDDNIDGIINAPGWHNLLLHLKKPRLISEYNVLRDVCIQQPSIMVYKMPTGIQEIKNSSVKIYPNPTNNQIFIEAEKIREVEIMDITGRRVYTLQTEATNKIQIDLKEFALASGTYFVKIKTMDFVSTQKIFVQH